MTFEENYNLGTKIILVMKALDRLILDKHKDIKLRIMNDNMSVYSYRDEIVGRVTKDIKAVNFSKINHTKKIVFYRPEAGCVEIFHNGNVHDIENSNPILTPTEEQYFQNSLIYEQDAHLRIFTLYGLMKDVDFKHKEITMHYNNIDKLVEIAKEVMMHDISR